MKRAFVLALGAALTLTSSASAWTYSLPAGQTWARPVHYVINDQGSVDLGGFAATVPEVRRGMEDWTRVECAQLTVIYDGPTTRVPDVDDDVNTIGWIESGWRHDSNSIGVTRTWFSPSQIVEADMSMNGVHFTWTTGPGSRNNVNTYSISLHEAGHFFGLGHSALTSATMYRGYRGGVLGITADDATGVCTLYPGGSGDCTMTGCPSGQECVAGSCEWIFDERTVCAPCEVDADCGGVGNLCVVYPDDNQYCGRSCGSDADCGGDICAVTGGGVPQCARRVGGALTCTNTTCTNDEDCPTRMTCLSGICRGAGACGTDADCPGGRCVDGQCLDFCDWTDASACGTGSYCAPDPATCEGICQPGSRGFLLLGEICIGDVDCVSGLCAGERCEQPCTADTDLCPTGQRCQFSGGCLGQCVPALAAGEACMTDDECASELCVAVGERAVCADRCDDGTCPEGSSCEALGEDRVCLPDMAELGEPCGANADCVSGLCGGFGDDMICTQICSDAEPCPDDFACIGTGTAGEGACAPTAPEMEMASGCACRATHGTAPRGGLVLGLLLALIALRRARRRHGKISEGPT